MGTGINREQTPKQLARARMLADSLQKSFVPDLRNLAAAIAMTGDGGEQEVLCDQVLPTLGAEVDRPLMVS
ncbi:hypothetical protein AB0J40_29050 [Amycolatopsis sp. NPDC049691]|uniref:hypothetical protein n=1 Tax=Amycolatopsis sp. NPDC049691 TaxID=3155155 RepID=UPI00344A6661